MMNKFGPKKAGHPSIGEKCPACGIMFKEGDYTALIAIGPGDDKEAQRKCREGESFNAIALEVHYACATGEE